MITRRKFISGIIAASLAPAIVKAESLMKIRIPREGFILPDEITSIRFDGSHTFKLALITSERADGLIARFEPEISTQINNVEAMPLAWHSNGKLYLYD